LYYNLDAYAYIGELCEAMLEDQDEDQARIEQLKERERAKRATTLVTLEAIINDNYLRQTAPREAYHRVIGDILALKQQLQEKDAAPATKKAKQTKISTFFHQMT
jgi:hypothetical protein